MNVQLHPKRCQRGDIPMGLAALLVVIVLLAALGFAGYAWYTTRSKNAQIVHQLQQLQEDQKKAEIDRQKSDLQKQKAEDDAKLAVAKNHQQAFFFRAKSLTNDLEALVVQIPGLQAQLERLRTGEDGKKVAVFPDLVLSARIFFQKDVRDLPTRDEAIQRLESMRRLLVQLAENAATAFEPTGEMTAALDDTRLWTDTATRRVQSVKGIAGSLLREAEIKVPPGSTAPAPPSLQAAMDAETQKEWAVRRQEETDKTRQAEDQANTKRVDANTNRIIVEAEIETERLRKAEEEKRAAHERDMARKQAEIEAAKRRAEAQTVEVKNLLAPFVSPGMWDPSPSFGPRMKDSPTPRPMSYAALLKAGCLEPSSRGVALLCRAAADSNDKMRPRWPIKEPRRYLQNPTRLAEVNKVQDLLIRLGPTMVELGILDP